VNVARVHRVSGGWHVTTSLDDLVVYESVADMPEPIRANAAALLTAPVGFRDERVGRRVADDVMWVFMKGETRGKGTAGNGGR